VIVTNCKTGLEDEYTNGRNLLVAALLATVAGILLICTDLNVPYNGNDQRSLLVAPIVGVSILAAIAWAGLEKYTPIPLLEPRPRPVAFAFIWVVVALVYGAKLIRILSWG
jgi:hypothetical protein